MVLSKNGCGGGGGRRIFTIVSIAFFGTRRSYNNACSDSLINDGNY